MRELIRKFWNKIKWPLFLLLWTIGTISWTYFYQEFTALEKQANWTIQEVQKLQEQRIEIKSSGIAVDKETSYSTEVHEQPEGREADKIVSPPPSGEIENIILAYFKDDYQTAKAVFTAESRLQKDAQGWNCHYGTESRACAPEDRGKAWSVDCGVAQINVLGKVCPQELFDPNYNLEVARKKYEARRWQPWSAYKNKSYLAYINN